MALGALVASPAGVLIAAAVGLLLVYRYASAAEFPPAATCRDKSLYMPVGPLALQVKCARVARGTQKEIQGSQELVRTAEIGPFGRRVDFRDFRRFRPSEPMWVRLQGCAPTAQYGELAQAERQACAWVTDVAF